MSQHKGWAIGVNHTILGTETGGNVTGVKIPEADRSLPTSFKLFQNYPNPFNAETTLSYEISSPSRVKLTVYDLLGRQVIVLVNEFQPSGKYRLTWDGKNENGKEASTGLYFVRLLVGRASRVQKMTLLR